MPQSVLDAIRLGEWDFDPGLREPGEYPSTDSLPGTSEKLNVLAARVQQGLPLWHPHDRTQYGETEKV